MGTVYFIRNLINGRVYIGATKRLGRRKREHWSLLFRGAHRTKRLQDDWLLHGPEAFVFEEFMKSNLYQEYEAFWIEFFHGLGLCYNTFPTSTPRGWKMPDEVKEKIRQATKGRDLLTREARLRQANTIRGRAKPAHVMAALRAGWEKHGERENLSKKNRSKRKLDGDAVNEIRMAIASGAEKYSDIAARFGISASTVCLIHQRKRYADF